MLPPTPEPTTITSASQSIPLPLRASPGLVPPIFATKPGAGKGRSACPTYSPALSLPIHDFVEGEGGGTSSPSTCSSPLGAEKEEEKGRRATPHPLHEVVDGRNTHP